jgi:flagellar biosynthetic protein FlhB
MASENGERTEAATPRKRQEARAKGQVARSPELVSALIILGTFGAMGLGGAAMGRSLLATVTAGLHLGGRGDLDFEAVRGLFLAAAGGVVRAALPVVLAGAVMGLAANLVQVGFLVTTERLHPNWERFNPMQGLKNLVSSRGALELVKTIIKLAIVGTVAYRTLAPEWARFPEMAQADPWETVAWQGSLVVRLGLRVGGVYCLLAVGDYLYQRWRFERDLRMTKAEIREEARQHEGSPQIRARVRSIQRERAMRRMMEEVPKASVVVVNPIHIAVALKYDPASMRAPRVVAKGKRLVAQRIVEAARAAGVPVVQDIPLARALMKMVDIGGEIPAAFYRAVAQILAYVYARDPRRAPVPQARGQAAAQPAGGDHAGAQASRGDHAGAQASRGEMS